MTNREIQILVAQAQNGSQLAFSKLYAPCYNAALAVCNGHVEAEDIAITAVGKAFEKINTYKGEKATFLTFVCKIAKNLLIDNYRKNKIQVCELDSNINIAEQDSDIEAEHQERLSKLEAVLNERKKSEKEGKIDIVPIILEMRMQGKKENEIADELGIKRGVVAMSMRRLSERVQAAN